MLVKDSAAVGVRPTSLIVLLVLAALALGACGGDDDSTSTAAGASGASGPAGASEDAYPQSQETAFLQNCEHQAQVTSNTARDFTDACQCSLDYVEARLPYGRFKDDIVAYIQSGQLSPTLNRTFNQAIQSCESDLTPP